MRKKSLHNVLTLRVGDIVEVRTGSEIRETLDETGALGGVPFMPEMLRYCGQRFRVFKRADKTCDTIDKSGLRRMEHTVLLENLHCDGSAHGECQAGCYLFWKEQWLRRVPRFPSPPTALVTIQTDMTQAAVVTGDRSHAEIRAALMKFALVSHEHAVPGEERYRCQITELKRASFYLAPWDLRQYVRDVCSGNRKMWEVIRWLLIGTFNWFQNLRRGVTFPYIESGRLKSTPIGNLNLQPGDLVEVKTEQEILETLNPDNMNRGLYFDVGMVRFCGEQFRVQSRANRIIDQKSGKMIRVPDDNPFVILEGVICHGDFWNFCPRSEYLFWRECWLKKAS